MTIEEKAKAYDEAKARISRAWNENRCTIGFMNEIFPKFKENEDERIRKAIVKHFELYHERENVVRFHGVDYENILAWLEKQKEPELYEDLGDYIAELSKQFPEVSFAKLSRIAVRVKNWLEKQGEQKSYGQGKECLDCQFNYVGECKGSCAMKRSEQKSAWSEEDERLLESTTAFIEANNTFCSWKGKSKKDILSWLKTFKDRVIPQPKPIWSEEDEKQLMKAIWYVDNPAPLVLKDTMLIEWLKQLKQRIGG